MGFLLFLAVVALGAIAWLLFKIDAKLQAIGDMIHDANRPEKRRRPMPEHPGGRFRESGGAARVETNWRRPARLADAIAVASWGRA